MASFYDKGYRLLGRDNDMTWDEFASILGSLGPESPLGRLVQIRLETDAETVKNFTPAQRKVRTEWKLFRAAELSKRVNDMTQKEKDKEEQRASAFFDGLFNSLKNK